MIVALLERNDFHVDFEFGAVAVFDKEVAASEQQAGDGEGGGFTTAGRRDADQAIGIVGDVEDAVIAAFVEPAVLDSQQDDLDMLTAAGDDLGFFLLVGAKRTRRYDRGRSSGRSGHVLRARWRSTLASRGRHCENR
jgi:hypothetical protein